MVFVFHVRKRTHARKNAKSSDSVFNERIISSSFLKKKGKKKKKKRKKKIRTANVLNRVSWLESEFILLITPTTHRFLKFCE